MAARSARLFLFCALWVGLWRGGVVPALAAEPNAVYLSDLAREQPFTSRQGWGALGLDTSAVPPHGGALPLRIGSKTYAKGLGHHAAGEIVVALQPLDLRFCAEAGVQWQGGKRGSTVLQVVVDGVKKFDSGVMSDSSAPLPVDIPLAGARELRLVATDGGDGIGCDMATWVEARLLRDSNAPAFGPVAITLCGAPAPPRSASVCGFSVVAAERGPQVAFLEPAQTAVVSVAAEEEVRITVPARCGSPAAIRASVTLAAGKQAEVAICCGQAEARRTLDSTVGTLLELAVPALPAESTVAFVTRAKGGEAGVRWSNLRLVTGKDALHRLPLPQATAVATTRAPAAFPNLRPAIERELIEWDWRMQDGIGTPRQPATFAAAAKLTLDRGARLLAELQANGVDVAALAKQGEELRAELAKADPGEPLAEDLWRRAHVWRRQLVLANPLARTGPLVFVKQVPSIFSHQLTQYYGSCARPGGGVFVLEAPGQSMACRQLAAGTLPEGSYQHVDVSADGERILFAYCHAETTPSNRESHLNRVYHVYEVRADSSGLRQLTDGKADDFCPRYLPDGKLLFLSTRRGGFHRCGRGPCAVYTLTLAEGDGKNPRTISFHETNEWDPAVMNDGRIVYTRWDYVDRSAVYYQQLWSARPDGSDVRIFYGNNTFNPVGVWEARPIPGSRRVMATAAAHHAMTAGSIILLDPTMGTDGLAPITRLTPDAPFPESETAVAPSGWRGDAGIERMPPVPVEAQRWPGHCYRSPYPLSETLFLAAYSFDALIGEPSPNPANMFGLYLADAFGNKELLYRDLNICSLWPMPLRPHALPPPVPSLAEVRAGTAEQPQEGADGKEGVFFLADVYTGYPQFPKTPIARLRILQVLPKSTPHINAPPVGLANASPGKQVLGTVPVEVDGSAFFRAPAGVALMFQALDERGQAVQTMRSITYLQPGEVSSCVGCHEHRVLAPPPATKRLALSRPPSRIQPGPDGSNPLSYPRLVQPVLDKHCIRCHSAPERKDGVLLTGEPEGPYTRSYNILAKRVPFSAWTGGNFRQSNCEPMTYPDRFGARASPLMKKLLAGHKDVVLTAEDRERLATWMDANALFYGTFKAADQARQQKGERIEGPDLQ